MAVTPVRTSFAFDERDLADLDPGDVGDGVERAGGQDADDEAEFAGPGTVLRGQEDGAEGDSGDPGGEAGGDDGGHGFFLGGHGVLIIRRRAPNDKRGAP